MDLDNVGLFKLMSRRMNWLTQRQETLAQNIANANTPDYKPQDLKPFTFRDALSDEKRMAMQATESGHLAGRPVAVDNKVRRQRDPYETKPDGNAVVVEEQMMKVGATSNDYDQVLTLYKKQLTMLQTAIRGTR
jgi:flagellar basal-body rod protein FlgB